MMAKYSRNQSTGGDRPPVTTTVSDDQSYEYRKDRGFVTVRYFFGGRNWEDWINLMAEKKMSAAHLSYFLGAKFDSDKRVMFIRGDFRFATWQEKFARRFEHIRFVLASNIGVRLGLSSDDDDLRYFVNGIDVGDIIRESDQRQAQEDLGRAQKSFPDE